MLVTGATGYIAAHIVKALLDTGEYKVKATVRSTSSAKAENLKSVLGQSDKLELVEADLLNPDSWPA